MRLNLYDKDLNRIGLIGSNFVSCLWAEGYNSVENFTLELRATEEWKEKLKPELYVGRADRNTLMVIKTIEVVADTIVCHGEQASRVLDDVAFVGTINDNMIIDNALNNAYNKSSKYYNLEYKASGLKDTYKHQISNKSMLELMETMCLDEDLGFRTIKEGKKLKFELYKPIENPNLIFAQNLRNLNLENITLSTEQEKNYAIVLGQGEGTDRVRVDVDLSNGTQHKELIVDAKQEQQDEGETLEDYNKRLYAVGIEKLLEQSKTWEVSATPLADDFGKRYELGDILTIRLLDYGLTIKSRLARFQQNAKENKVDTTIEVGEITIVR